MTLSCSVRWPAGALLLLVLGFSGCGGGGNNNSGGGSNEGSSSAPNITTTLLPSGIAGFPYTAQLSATSGQAPYHWSAAGLPSNLSLDAGNGTISGTPTGPGNSQVAVTVTDSASRQGLRSFNLIVSPAMTITGGPWGDGTAGQYYSASYDVSGGITPITWAVTGGTSPQGMSLSAKGQLAGTPFTGGAYTFTVQAKDSGSPQQIAQLDSKLNVKASKLTISSVLPNRLALGSAFRWRVTATGGTPPYQWTTLSASVPPGMNYDPATREVSGAPTALGRYGLVLQATDSGSPAQVQSQTFIFNVSGAQGRNDSPAHATAIGDGYTYASISPYAEPADSDSPVPDTDYYKILAVAGNVVKAEVFARRAGGSPLDSVLELVDANGARLSSCRQPSEQGDNFASECLNDDIIVGQVKDSELEVKVPGPPGTQSTVYAHVFDWRGDARPDLTYNLVITGSIQPLVAQAPFETQNSEFPSSGRNACPVSAQCTARFTALGGTGGVSWSLDSGNTPPGMNLGTDGTFSGTPATQGTYDFVARATDSGTPPQTATAAFHLLIESNPGIVQDSLPSGVTGQPYQAVLSGTSGTGPYTFLLMTGLPSGLSLDENTGTISGVPSAAGSFVLAAEAQDVYWLRGFKNVNLQIDPGKLVWQDATYPDGNIGIRYIQYFRPSGGSSPYRIDLIGGSVPSGLYIGSDGMLDGLPTAAGTYRFTLQATDAENSPQQVTANFQITINP